MFQIDYCEYNRTNVDYDRIYRPGGSGDYLLLLLKTPMKCHLKGKLEISGENACLLYAPRNVRTTRRCRNSGTAMFIFLRIFRLQTNMESRPQFFSIRKISWNWTNTSA